MVSAATETSEADRPSARRGSRATTAASREHGNASVAREPRDVRVKRERVAQEAAGLKNYVSAGRWSSPHRRLTDF
jgi:hypothetical protein